MEISEKSIEEFKKIYKEVFKEDISDQKALEKGTRLINLIKAVYRVDKGQDKKDVRKIN